MVRAHRTCLGCGYNLENLPEHRCPECGRTFNPDDSATFGPRSSQKILWEPWASVACTVIYFCSLYLDIEGRRAIRGWDPWYGHGGKFVAFIVLFGISVGLVLATFRRRCWIRGVIGGIGVAAMCWQIVCWIDRFIPYAAW